MKIVLPGKFKRSEVLEAFLEAFSGDINESWKLNAVLYSGRLRSDRGINL
jgi:hypothetical protein